MKEASFLTNLLLLRILFVVALILSLANGSLEESTTEILTKPQATSGAGDNNGGGGGLLEEDNRRRLSGSEIVFFLQRQDITNLPALCGNRADADRMEWRGTRCAGSSYEIEWQSMKTLNSAGTVIDNGYGSPCQWNRANFPAENNRDTYVGTCGNQPTYEDLETKLPNEVYTWAVQHTVAALCYSSGGPVATIYEGFPCPADPTKIICNSYNTLQNSACASVRGNAQDATWLGLYMGSVCGDNPTVLSDKPFPDSFSGFSTAVGVSQVGKVVTKTASGSSYDSYAQTDEPVREILFRPAEANRHKYIFLSAAPQGSTLPIVGNNYVVAIGLFPYGRMYNPATDTNFAETYTTADAYSLKLDTETDGSHVGRLYKNGARLSADGTFPNPGGSSLYAGLWFAEQGGSVDAVSYLFPRPPEAPSQAPSDAPSASIAPSSSPTYIPSPFVRYIHDIANLPNLCGDRPDADRMEWTGIRCPGNSNQIEWQSVKTLDSAGSVVRNNVNGLCQFTRSGFSTAANLQVYMGTCGSPPAYEDLASKLPQEVVGFDWANGVSQVNSIITNTQGRLAVVGTNRPIREISFKTKATSPANGRKYIVLSHRELGRFTAKEVAAFSFLQGIDAVTADVGQLENLGLAEHLKNYRRYIAQVDFAITEFVNNGFPRAMILI